MTVNLPPPCLGQSPRCGVTWMGNWGEMGSLLGWAAVFFFWGGAGVSLIWQYSDDDLENWDSHVDQTGSAFPSGRSSSHFLFMFHKRQTH